MEGHTTLLLAVIGGVIALGINILVGNLLFEPRPFVSYPTLVHKLIAHAADASFPSDHAAVSFAIATVLIAAALQLARAWGSWSGWRSFWRWSRYWRPLRLRSRASMWVCIIPATCLGARCVASSAVSSRWRCVHCWRRCWRRSSACWDRLGWPRLGWPTSILMCYTGHSKYTLSDARHAMGARMRYRTVSGGIPDG